MRRALIFAVVLALGTTAASAQGTPVIDLQIAGGQAKATISAPPYDLEVTLSFEQVVGLSAANLGLSAVLIDPLDPALLARLPASVSVPLALPLMVSVEPPASGGLSFSGLATIELYTHDLEFTAGCPLRVFTAHAGGPFEEITDFMGMGSYRGRGRTGGFSDFLLLADTRPPSEVVDLKLDHLWGLLDAYDELMAAAVVDSLATELAAAESAWRAGDTTAASAHVDELSRQIEAASGSAIPDVWRSARDLVNVAGELRAAAATLRFSINLAG